MESEWIKIRGGLVHSLGVSSPDGALSYVILVHGLVVSSRYMAPAAERLADDYCVKAPDLPGYGSSYKPDKILNVRELADALAEWMSVSGIYKAHLVGNSFGCQILAEFALHYQERINRLVLQGPTVDPAARSLVGQFSRLFFDAWREHPKLGLILWRDYRAAGLRRSWRTVQIALEDRIEDKLPNVQAATLVVRGEHDPLVPQQWAEQVTALLPRGSLHVIPAAAHTVNYSAPEKFVAAIRPFLQAGER